MSKKLRKTFDKSDWTDYEVKFYNLCRKKNWTVFKDEDGCPILRPAHKDKIKLYKVGAFGKGICDFTLTASTGASKTKFINKFKRAKILYKMEAEGDTEVILTFPIEKLPRVVKMLNLKKKQNHPGPPKDAIKKGLEKLKSNREGSV